MPSLKDIIWNEESEIFLQALFKHHEEARIRILPRQSQSTLKHDNETRL